MFLLFFNRFKVIIAFKYSKTFFFFYVWSVCLNSEKQKQYFEFGITSFVLLLYKQVQKFNFHRTRYESYVKTEDLNTGKVQLADEIVGFFFNDEQKKRFWYLEVNLKRRKSYSSFEKIRTKCFKVTF